MEPIFKDINQIEPLLSAITYNDETYTAVTINKLIFRPILKRIVFITQEFDRVILYEEAEYATHTGDTNNALINDLIHKIAATYTGDTK